MGIGARGRALASSRHTSSQVDDDARARERAEHLVGAERRRRSHGLAKLVAVNRGLVGCDDENEADLARCSQSRARTIAVRQFEQRLVGQRRSARDVLDRAIVRIERASRAPTQDACRWRRVEVEDRSPRPIGPGATQREVIVETTARSDDG